MEEPNLLRNKSMKIILSLILFTFIGVQYSNAQELNVCINFEDSIDISQNIKIDSGSIWEIGKPTKLVLDSSYQSQNSIVTSTGNLYNSNDTSIFYLVVKNLPDYLYLYPPIHYEMRHRFKTHSKNDYGKLEISIDYGQKWYNVFTRSSLSGIDNVFNNSHFFESGDIVDDSLLIAQNSNGWIQSFVDINLQAINNPVNDIDSAIFRYTFISDSTSVDEGWQVDDVCIRMDLSEIIDIKEYQKNENRVIEIAPNPAKELINITIGNVESFSLNSIKLEVFNYQGEKILENNTEVKSVLKLDVSDYAKGIYFIKASINGKEYGSSKFVKD